MSKNVNADGVVVAEAPKRDNIFGSIAAKPTPKKIKAYKPTPLGSPYIYRAKLSYSDNGDKIAEIGEKFDLDSKIQAAKDSTDIAAIVARYKAGDDSVLHVNPGFVGDSVTLPKDIYDVKAMNELYDKVSGSFNTLPADIKALFNNSVEDYLNSIISNKANEIIKNYQASQNQQEAPKEEGK